MRDSERRQRVRRIAAASLRLLEDHGRLMAQIRSMQAGYPSRGGAGGGGGSGPVMMIDDERIPLDSTTEAAVLSGGVDPAKVDLARIDRLVTQADKAMTELDRLTSSWIKPRPGQSDIEGEPGCEVVARCGGWEPVYRRSDIGGLLPEPLRLGRWAYRFIVQQGKVPSTAQIAAHLEGRRVLVRAQVRRGA